MEKMNSPQEDSLDSFEALPNVEKTIIRDLNNVFSKYMFSEEIKAVKDWNYRLPQLDNAILVIRAQLTDEGGRLDIQLWDKDGEPLVDSLKIISDKGMVGDLSNGRIRIYPEDIEKGFNVERNGTPIALVEDNDL